MLLSGVPAIGGLGFQVTEYRNGTADGELTGTVTGDPAAGSWLVVQVDLDADGTADWTGFAPADVGEFHANVTLPFGPNFVSVSISEVAANGDETWGDGFSGTLTVPPPNDPGTVAGLGFTVRGEGTQNGFPGLIAGFLTADVADTPTPWIGSYLVQYRIDGGGVVDAGTVGGDETGFAVPQVLAPGPHTAQARVVEYDGGGSVVGEAEWSSVVTFVVTAPDNDAPQFSSASPPSLNLSEIPDGVGSSSPFYIRGQVLDRTRFESRYDLQVWQSGYAPPPLPDPGNVGSGGDGWYGPEANFAAEAYLITGNEQFQVRIVEADEFGRLRVTPWTAVVMNAAAPEPNVAPVFNPQPGNPWPFSYTLSSRSVQNGPIGGAAITANDANAGDVVKYAHKEWIAGGFLGVLPKAASKNALSVDKDTGAITIIDKDILIAALKKDYKYAFTLYASDGKTTTSKTVTLYESHEPYLTLLDGHVSDWYASALSALTNTHESARAAFASLRAFAGDGAAAFTGATSNFTNGAWAASAFSRSPKTAGTIGCAAVVIQAIINAKAANATADALTIVNAAQDAMDAAFQKDLDNLEDQRAAWREALAQLVGDILNVPPDEKTRAVVQKLNEARDALRIDFIAPTENDVFGELLLSFAKTKGFRLWGSDVTLQGGDGFWDCPDLPGWGIDGDEVAAKLNEIQYQKHTLGYMSPFSRSLYLETLGRQAEYEQSLYWYHLVPPQ